MRVISWTVEPERPEEPIVEAELDGWRIRARVSLQVGVPTVTEIHVEPVGEIPPGGLTPTVLRRVAVEQLRAYAQHTQRVLSQPSPALFFHGGVRVLGRTLADDVRSGLAVNARRPPEPMQRRGAKWWALVADRYVGALARGERHVVVAVARELGVEPKTIKEAVRAARRTQLLSDDESRKNDEAKGWARGVLTAKAMEILRGGHR